MISAVVRVPQPTNEPVCAYAVGSAERTQLKRQLSQMWSSEVEIPLVIGGEAVHTGRLADCRSPHQHRHVLGRYHQASSEDVTRAIEAATAAARDWAATPWEARLSVFVKAAELLARRYRSLLNAATMLGQGKTAHQAEIDSACELIDFLRFNTWFASQLMQQQPNSAPGVWNYVDHRPLEGFVFAVSPFNFTAIAGNLPTAPAMMGNTVVWKPASSAVYSAHYLMQLLSEAGLPAGVINFVPGPGRQVGDPALQHPALAGIHFTGSTPVFQQMWHTVGNNIAGYKSYPRIVGETGGKNFVVAHRSADADALVSAIVRGAFEYQGQKCSAASRLYLPESLHRAVKQQLADQIRSIKIGPPTDFRNFMTAVIDADAFKTIKGYIDYARQSSESEIVVGGECDDADGYFIRPTLVQTTDPQHKLMQEEIFGPVTTLFVYPDKGYNQILELCDRTSPYALTGAIFATDRQAIEQAQRTLRHAAGNFYINDKPTGAVVGQQPFGGARASGTNDKAGSPLNLARWISPRTVKETFVPARDYRYPFMAEA